MPETETQSDEPRRATTVARRIARLAVAGALGLALVAAPALGDMPRFDDRVEHRTDDPPSWILGEELEEKGDLAGARAAYEQALEFMRVRAALAPEVSRISHVIAILHRRIGILLESEGRTRDALAHFTELVTLRTALAAEDPGDRVRRAWLAWAHLTLGNALQSTGSPQDARRHLIESVAIQAPWATPDAPPDVRRDYAVALGDLADLEGDLGEHDSAARRFSDARAILQTLRRQDPFSESLQEDDARLLFFQGANRSERGDSKGALEAFRESRHIRLALLHRDPDDLERRARLAVSSGRLAKAYEDRDDPKAAAFFYRDAIENIRPLVVGRLADIPRRRLLLRYLYRLADCLADQGDTSERGVLYLRAVGLADRVLAAEPTDPSRRYDRAFAGQKFGRFEEDGERYASAWRAYEDARRIFQELAEEAPDRRDRQTDLASIDDDLGDVWLAMKAVSEARQFYQKAYDIIERLLDGDPQDTLRSELAHHLRKLAKVDEATGDVSGALDRLKQARIILELEAVERPDNTWISKETKLVVDHIARLSRARKP